MKVLPMVVPIIAICVLWYLCGTALQLSLSWLVPTGLVLVMGFGFGWVMTHGREPLVDTF